VLNLNHLKEFISELEEVSDEEFSVIHQDNCLVFNKEKLQRLKRDYKEQSKKFDNLYWLSLRCKRFIKKIASHLPDTFKVSEKADGCDYTVTDTSGGFKNRQHCILKLKRVMTLWDLQKMSEIIVLEQRYNIIFDSISIPYRGENHDQFEELIGLYCSTSQSVGITLAEETSFGAWLSGIPSTLFVSKRSWIVKKLQENLSEINAQLEEEPPKETAIQYSEHKVFEPEEQKLLPPPVKQRTVLHRFAQIFICGNTSLASGNANTDEANLPVQKNQCPPK
jgi:hypothetical protein